MTSFAIDAEAGKVFSLKNVIYIKVRNKWNNGSCFWFDDNKVIGNKETGMRLHLENHSCTDKNV